MAQKVQILLIDDIDGGEADETISFALDGHQYEIDVSESHAAELRGAITTYAQLGRKVKGGGKRTAPRNGTAVAPAATNGTSKHSAREIRDWARSNGLDVPDRGRVPQEVRDQFEAAVG